MTTNIEDLFGEDGGGQSPAPASLEQIKEVGQRAADLKREIDDLDKALGAKKKEFLELTQTKLPMMMGSAQMTKFVLESGVEIAVGEFINATLPKEPEARRAAFNWLEENDGEGIIKTEVSVAFAKSQYDEAKKVADRLEKDGLPVNFETNVHPQTLAAWVRERLSRGEPVDQKVLGVYVGRVAKLKGL